MKYIDCDNNKIKLADDKTYQNVVIYISKDMDINDVVTRIAVELLKGD